MKAIVYTRYGLPDELKLEEVEKPVPADDEVLVKIRAASINASDYEFLTAKPAYIRMWRLTKPKFATLGSDIAGIVEAVGKNVTRFEPGDAVLGDLFGRWGGFAEYACAPESALVRKPEGMSFEEAAALPQSSVVALQGLRDKGRVKPGEKVLINGAGGGAGTFALQLARLYGAEVTAVDSAEKLETMRALGAHRVLDYAREDCTRSGQLFDLVLDLVGGHSVLGFRRTLGPGGRYVLVGATVPHILGTLVLGSLVSVFGSREMGLLAHRQNTEDMNHVLKLCGEKTLHPVIDRRYPLDETAEAFRYFGGGHAKGKVVITV